MKNLLLTAKHEVEALRRRNEILQAKVDVMELFACVLHTAPATYSQGMGVDVAWELQRELERIEAREKAGPAPVGMNHFCPGESGNGEWSHRSTDVNSVCGYCGEANAIQWNPYNQVVQDHRDGTIHHEATNEERAKRGLEVPWTPEIAERELGIKANPVAPSSPPRSPSS